MGIIKEKYMLSSRRETVALSASAVKSVRFVDARKCGYRVSDGRHIGIFGVAGNGGLEAGGRKSGQSHSVFRATVRKPFGARRCLGRCVVRKGI